jgi:DNA modification methylase
VGAALYCGDSLRVMSAQSENSVDLILADLPYGNTACKWDSCLPLDLLWVNYTRLLRSSGCVLLFGSQPFTSKLVMSNLSWFRCEWVWHKSNGGGFLNANRQPLKRHESVLVFAPQQPTYHPQKTVGKPYMIKSKSAGETTQDQTVAGWTTRNKGDRFPTSVQYFKSETGLHPTQKPVTLLSYLIKTYSNEGETVLDNTMGSGSTGVAAVMTSRNFVGIERDEKYFRVARDRIMGAM